jgi:tetratricopeptide (TPR) repeat protein
MTSEEMIRRLENAEREKNASNKANTDRIIKAGSANTDRLSASHTANTDRIIKAGSADTDRMIDAQNEDGSRTREVIKSGFGELHTRIGDAISAVEDMAQNICGHLNAIINQLDDMELTQAQGLTHRAYVNLQNGYYKEAREELMRAIKRHKTNPFSWYLLGLTYMSSAQYPLVYDKAINALSNASKYIVPYFRKGTDVIKLVMPVRLAEQIEFYLGLVQCAKFKELRAAGKAAEARPLLDAAQKAFGRSVAYSGGR